MTKTFFKLSEKQLQGLTSRAFTTSVKQDLHMPSERFKKFYESHKDNEKKKTRKWWQFVNYFLNSVNN